MSKSDRQYFRLKYPSKLAPYIEVKNEMITLVELAEESCAFHQPFPNIYSLGEPVKGELHYANKEKDLIEGYVLFIRGDKVVVKLTKGVAFQRIMEEQKFIRQHCPDFQFKL